MIEKIVRSAFYDYSVIALSLFASLLIRFGNTTLLARLLGPTNYGKMTLFLVVSQLIFLFGANWTSAAVVRYGREEYVESGSIAKTFWGRNIVLVPVVFVIFGGTLFFKKEVSRYIGLSKEIVWLIIAFVAAKTINNYIQYIQQAIGQLKNYGILLAFADFLFLIFLISIYFSLIPCDLIFVIFLDGLSLLIASMVFILPFNKGMFWPISIDMQFVKKILSFSYPYIFGSAASYIVGYIDIIAIKHYMKPTDVGIYALSYQCITAIQTISISIISVLNPLIITFFAEKRNDLIVKYTKRIILQSVLLWNLMLLIALPFAFFLVPKVFGVDFDRSVIPLSILMVGQGFNCWVLFYTPIVQAYELNKQAVRINILMAVLNLIGDIAFVPMIGIDGAAIATSISLSIGAMMYSLISDRFLKIRDLYRIILPVLPLITMVALSFCFRSILTQLLMVIVIFGITIFTIKKAGVFHGEDAEMFYRVNIPIFLRKTVINIYRFLEA